MREPDVVWLAAGTTKLGFRKALRLKRDGWIRMNRWMDDGSLFGSMAGARQVAKQAAISKVSPRNVKLFARMPAHEFATQVTRY